MTALAASVADALIRSAETAASEARPVQKRSHPAGSVAGKVTRSPSTRTSSRHVSPNRTSSLSNAPQAHATSLAVDATPHVHA